MNFKQWINEQTTPGTVSFDFDGVLHIDVYPGTTQPIDLFTTDLTPYLAMHKKLREEAKTHKIILVSARDQDGEMDQVAIDFCKMHHLPISQYFFTNGQQKVSILKKQKVIRHYDDNPDMAYQLMGTGIEFIHVTSPMQEGIGPGLWCTSRPEADQALHRLQFYRPCNEKLHGIVYIKKNNRRKHEKF